MISFCIFMICCILLMPLQIKGTFFKKYGEDAKIPDGIKIERKDVSLLTCTQICNKDEKCELVNYNHDEKQCEVFQKSIKHLGKENSNGWSIYVIDKVCKPNNKCKNLAKCIQKTKIDYECKCQNKCHLGRYCETDLNFEINFQENKSYAVTNAIDFDDLTKFTLCFTFSGLIPKEKLRVLSYGEDEITPLLDFYGNPYSFEYTLFGSRTYNLSKLTPLAPQKDLPTATCISYDAGSMVKVSLADELEEWPLTTDYLNIFYGGKKLVFGSEVRPKYSGKIAFLFFYNRVLTNEEMENYAKMKWVLDDSLFYMFDKSKAEKSLKENATLEKMLDCEAELFH